MSDSTPDVETLLGRLDEAMERITELEEKLGKYSPKRVRPQNHRSKK